MFTNTYTHPPDQAENINKHYLYIYKYNNIYINIIIYIYIYKYKYIYIQTFILVYYSILYFLVCHQAGAKRAYNVTYSSRKFN